MSTLYLQVGRHNTVGSGPVLLGDVAELYCQDAKALSRCESICLMNIKEGRYGRYLVSVKELVEHIGRFCPELEIFPVGDSELVLEYKKQDTSAFLSWVKTLLVSFIVFIGSAFTIMTFITEANVVGLLARIRQEFAGTGGGMELLEIFYAVGVGVGMIFYFNHFGRWRLQQEPTPMEMELHQYMEDVEETVLELDADAADKGKEQK